MPLFTEQAVTGLQHDAILAMYCIQDALEDAEELLLFDPSAKAIVQRSDARCSNKFNLLLSLSKCSELGSSGCGLLAGAKVRNLRSTEPTKTNMNQPSPVRHVAMPYEGASWLVASTQFLNSTRLCTADWYIQAAWEIRTL